MAALLVTFLSIAKNWFVKEFKRIRNSGALLVIGPLILLFFAAYVGGWSWRAKLILIELDIAVMLVATLWLVAQRIKIAAVIVTAIAGLSAKKDLVDVADGYVKLVASILAAEIFAGLVTLWAPVHWDLTLSFLGFFIGIGWFVYWLWVREDVKWWKAAVYFSLVFSLLAVVSGLLIQGFLQLMPGTASEVAAHRGAPDKLGVAAIRGVVAVIRGDATAQTAFWVFAVLLAVTGAGVYLLKEKARQPVRRMVWLLLGILLISWFIWGAGAKAVAVPFVKPERAVTAITGLQRIEVALRPGEARRLDEWPNPLVPPGFSVDFEVLKGNVFLSSGGGEPKPIEGKGVRFPWQSPMVLSGDGTVALLLYRH